MIKKIEHLGIAVKDLNASIELYESLFQTKCYKIESVESEGVKTAFFQIGESKIELLQASNPDSPINEGFVLIHKSAKDGADNKIIAFLHPKSVDGLLVELCQEKSA